MLRTLLLPLLLAFAPASQERRGDAPLPGNPRGQQAAPLSAQFVHCTPTTVRFSDQDIRVGDLNGDGLPDIARVRSGQLLYWPGRGNGFWGTGRRDDCLNDGFAQERHIAMTNPPRFGTAQSGTLLLGDVNGDG